ncbi:histidine kinase [Sphingopyxis sp. YF1]|uniref:sensor histidine kinase n=1 Tax=Sphingopyxis sp. YF1 TaxID=2482763 RepID=UPI001F61C94D|nr:ATP-binding protein [Sphingopyxis sp. YF1]UNU42133.1 histidine kinase [Sphingopyxis sp. YF1]
MTIRFPPAAILIGTVLMGVVAVVALLYLTIHQPWLGVAITGTPAGEIRIAHVRADGPAQGITAPQRLIAVEGAGEESVTIEANDLVDEPDIAATYDEMARFFARQTEIDRTLRQATVTLRGTDNKSATVTPSTLRPLGDLPGEFWVQLCVGLAAWLVGAWVWSLRRSDPATALFALASFAILLATFPAALYSTRELAIDGGLFRFLSILNHGGALMFAAAMIALLLSYPGPLVSGGWRYAPFFILGPWWIADSLEILGGPPVGVHLPILLSMAAIIACAALQYLRASGDPGARAIIRWFGLSITVGAGSFALTVIAPSLIGLPPLLPQSYAFIFFLLIHVGLALGVARYRLFDLDRWAFRILFYMTAAALLLLVDAMLISWIAIGRAPAFGLALLLVALFYLPLRDTLARRLSGRSEPRQEAWFPDMIEVALAPSDKDRDLRWQALLNTVFRPLRISPGPDRGAPTLLEEGTALVIPAIGALPARRLDHAMHGRRLFSPRDVSRAAELCAMLAHALDSRIAYEQGVAAERGRITRDMHDNIGVQLLGALHSRDATRKDALIRDTLVDLREIINNSAGQGLTPDELMAELRADMADLLSSAGLTLVWNMEMVPDFPARAVPAMRSILREAVGNALRHADAATIRVTLVRAGDGLVLTVEDDGRGFVPDAVVPGHGLENMRARVAALKGRLAIEPAAPGTRITVHVPVEA